MAAVENVLVTGAAGFIGYCANRVFVKAAVPPFTLTG